MLTTEQFDRARRLASRLAGIELLDRHREILDRKGRRLGIRGAGGFEALLDAADGGDPRAARELIGLFTTNFTGFFRNPWHFHLAAEHALWSVHRRGRALLWSAAAATGEEPYSLAMAVIEVFRRPDPPVTIVATDIDEDALAVARRGEYGEAALATLEPGPRARFFGETTDGRHRRIAREARDLIVFRRLNLAGPAWPLEGPFDAVFCRNVLMYLDAGHRHAVLGRLASMLAPDGVLFLDPAENLGRAGHLFDGGADGVYRCRAATRPGRAAGGGGR